MQQYVAERESSGTAWTVQASADEGRFSVSVTAADTHTGLSVVEAAIEGELDALTEAERLIVEGLGVLIGKARPGSSSTVERARQGHPRAYQPWSTADDESLVAQWTAGRSISDLAQAFDRGEGAIRSRLTKLGHDPDGSRGDSTTQPAATSTV